MNIVFSIMLVCSVQGGRCLEYHVPHPDQTLATCESTIAHNAPVAINAINGTVKPGEQVRLGAFRCAEEPNRAAYKLAR